MSMPNPIPEKLVEFLMGFLAGALVFFPPVIVEVMLR